MQPHQHKLGMSTQCMIAIVALSMLHTATAILVAKAVTDAIRNATVSFYARK